MTKSILIMARVTDALAGRGAGCMMTSVRRPIQVRVPRCCSPEATSNSPCTASRRGAGADPRHHHRILGNTAVYHRLCSAHATRCTRFSVPRHKERAAAVAEKVSSTPCSQRVVRKHQLLHKYEEKLDDLLSGQRNKTPSSTP